MLACFEKRFGSYPFWEDGYKLVETPYLGMEHQSAVAYGNEYKMGYRGRDLSGTGVGLKWDFIIIHESAHEWFGNSITSARSEEHTSELQSLMRISYAVFCLKKKKQTNNPNDVYKVNKS